MAATYIYIKYKINLVKEYKKFLKINLLIFLKFQKEKV